MMITCGGYGEDDDDSWEKKLREREEIDGEQEDETKQMLKMMITYGGYDENDDKSWGNDEQTK